jgi:branched-subunit amino acid transport protein
MKVIMKICPYCAEAIQEDSQFCQFCGTNLGSPPVGAALSIPPAPSESHTSGKAVASLICGIFFFVLPAAIVAIILGHLSYSEIARSLGRIRGKGIALAGLILGYLGISFVPILIIAAIAIPNLLRSKMAANEASAVGSLRSYQYAMGAYASKCPKIGFPKSLANLGEGRGDCERASLLDSSLGTDQPIKSGYYFHYVVAEPDNVGQVISFVITADPVTPNSGVRHFYLDQTGIIRWNNDGPPDVGSPALQ